MFDTHGESRCAGLVHCHLLDVMGARARPRSMVHWVGEALGHTIDRATVLVDRGLRSSMHGWPRASCHILLVEPVFVCRGQTEARSSSVDRDIGPQQEWQLVLVGSRIGIHHSVWAPVAKSVLRSPAFPRNVGLLQVVVARSWSGAQT